MQNLIIFNPDYENQIVQEFQMYAFCIMYGDNLLMGRDIVDEYQDIPEDGEQ